jgi:16S rRNA (uracil1498-N3)-methyltransferase
MNLILFEKPFNSVRLDADDPRARHLHKVLCADVGTLVFVGFVNGLRAQAQVTSVSSDGCYELQVIAEEPAPALLPITLLIGLPRPHTARRILFEAASLGIKALHFFAAEHSEPSYAKSRLWQTGEWRERLLRGTEQAFGTRLPQVELHPDLQAAMAMQKEAGTKVALDNYEASGSLGTASIVSNSSAAIAIGPERGWSAAERSVFRENKWQLAHLGPHVLRTETACVAASAVLASRLNVWQNQTRD